MEEKKFLIDSNIIIYYLDDKIPLSQIKMVETIFKTSFTVSTISNIEVLGWRGLKGEDRTKAESFLSNATVIYTDKAIERKSIELKRKYNIETPDSIIAATAILNKLTLTT